MKDGSNSEVEVALPSRPAPVSATISSSSPIARQLPTPSSVAARSPNAPTTRSPGKSSAMRPVFVSQRYRALGRPTTSPTTKSAPRHRSRGRAASSKGRVQRSLQRVTEVKK
jgi:hypothetical protein